jgi:excisionase family DNA binding protein
MNQLKKKGPVKLTISDLSKRYNVTREAVYKWIKKGVIPADMVEKRFHGTAIRFYFKPGVKKHLDSHVYEKRLKYSQKSNL